ncbi:hypothetical protein Ddc_15573 [Ditylenchus destructor]|nr:hypothetical protein Ddc_15573 [Ditylenchus destructor]
MGAILSEYSYPAVIFSLVIGIPSMILYLIQNCLGWFFASFPTRLGRIGLFRGFFESLPSALLALPMFFGYYSFHADNLSTMLILLNRLTSLMLPFSHIKQPKIDTTHIGSTRLHIGPAGQRSSKSSDLQLKPVMFPTPHIFPQHSLNLTAMSYVKIQNDVRIPIGLPAYKKKASY